MSVPVGEGPHAPARVGFADWVTFAFATADGETCGMARLELSTGRDGEPRSAGHALVLRRGAVTAARAEGPAPARRRKWGDARAAGVQLAVEEPLARWSVSFGDAGGEGFELEFAALGEPAVFDPDAAFASTSGTQGHERLCRVTGTVGSGAAGARVECLGQRGHRWGTAADRLELTRDVDLWLDEGLAVVVAAARGKRAKPDAEALSACVLEGEPPIASGVEEARLSTTYDAERTPVRASVELWPTADAEMPRRAAGEAIGTGVLAIDDRHELVSTFLRWWMEGRAGVGHYALVRRS